MTHSDPATVEPSAEPPTETSAEIPAKAPAKPTAKTPAGTHPEIPAETSAGTPAAFARAEPSGTASPLDADDPSRLPIGELAERCGVVLTECTHERITATMPVAGNRQPFGLLHGGANAMLAETIGSVHATMLAGPGRVAVGVELNCTHHRSATDGTVTATCTPLHVGRSVSTFHIAIRDQHGRPTCTARLTCMTRSAQRGSGALDGSAGDTRR